MGYAQEIEVIKQGAKADIQQIMKDIGSNIPPPHDLLLHLTYYRWLSEHGLL